jgi:hypothetical protein
MKILKKINLIDCIILGIIAILGIIVIILGGIKFVTTDTIVSPICAIIFGILTIIVCILLYNVVIKDIDNLTPQKLVISVVVVVILLIISGLSYSIYSDIETIETSCDHVNVTELEFLGDKNRHTVVYLKDSSPIILDGWKTDIPTNQKIMLCYESYNDNKENYHFINYTII